MYGQVKVSPPLRKSFYTYSVINARYEQQQFLYRKTLYPFQSFEHYPYQHPQKCLCDKTFEGSVSQYPSHAAIRVSDGDVDIREHQYDPNNTYYLMVFEPSAETCHTHDDLLYVKEKLWCPCSELFPYVLTKHFHLIKGSDVCGCSTKDRNRVWTSDEKLTELVRDMNSGVAFVNLLYVSKSRENVEWIDVIFQKLFGDVRESMKPLVINLYVANFETVDEPRLSKEDYYTKVTDYMRPYGVSANTTREMNLKECRSGEMRLHELLEGFYSTRPSTLTHPILLCIPDELVSFATSDSDLVCGRFYRNGRNFYDTHKFFFVNELTVVPHPCGSSPEDHPWQWDSWVSSVERLSWNYDPDEMIILKKEDLQVVSPEEDGEADVIRYSPPWKRSLIKKDSTERLRAILSDDGSQDLTCLAGVLDKQSYRTIRALVDSARDCGSALLNRDRVFDVLKHMAVDVYKRKHHLSVDHKRQGDRFSYVSLLAHSESGCQLVRYLKDVMYNFPDCPSKKDLSKNFEGFQERDGTEHNLIAEEMIRMLDAMERELEDVEEEGGRTDDEGSYRSTRECVVTRRMGLNEEMATSKLFGLKNLSLSSCQKTLLYSTELSQILFSFGLNGIDVGATGTNPRVKLDDALCQPLDFWTFSKSSIVATLFDDDGNLAFTSSLANMKYLGESNKTWTPRGEKMGVVLPVVGRVQSKVSLHSLFMETDLFKNMLVSSLCQTPKVCKNTNMFRRLVDVLLIGMVRLKSIVTSLIEEEDAADVKTAGLLRSLRLLVQDLESNMEFYVKRTCEKCIIMVEMRKVETDMTSKERRSLFYVLSSGGLVIPGLDNGVRDIKENFMVTCLGETLSQQDIERMMVNESFRTEKLAEKNNSPLRDNLSWTEMFSQLDITDSVLSCLETARKRRVRRDHGGAVKTRPRCDFSVLADIIRENEKTNQKINVRKEEHWRNRPPQSDCRALTKNSNQHFVIENLIKKLTDSLQAKNRSTLDIYYHLSKLIETYKSFTTSSVSVHSSPHPFKKYLERNYRGNGFHSYNEEYTKRKKKRDQNNPGVPIISSVPPSADKLPEPTHLLK